MTVPLPSSNNLKVAQKSQNYTIHSPSPSGSVEQSGASHMSIRVSSAEDMSRSSPPSSSLSVTSSSPRQSQRQVAPNSHTSHNQTVRRNWALGTMLMFVLFLLSASTSSVVSVPLGGGGSRLHSLTGLSQEPREGQSMSSSPREEDVGEGGESRRNYMIQPQGQIYLPSFIQDPSEIGVNLPGQRQGDDDDSQRGKYGQQEEGQAQARYPTKSFQKHRQIPQNEEESSQAGWETVIDPHLYLLTEWNTNADQQQRMRRNVGPSLSIVNPLDVLRQRLLLEIARRKMRQSHNQIMANAEILKNIGRRRRR